MDKTPLVLIAILITIAAVANLIRFLWNIPAIIGTYVLPGWTGGIAFVALGLLAAWAFKSLFSSPSQHR